MLDKETMKYRVSNSINMFILADKVGSGKSIEMPFKSDKTSISGFIKGCSFIKEARVSFKLNLEEPLISSLKSKEDNILLAEKISSLTILVLKLPSSFPVLISILIN